MKPQPLDLEEFRKWRAKTNPDLTFSISQIEFIKQRLKSACEFYLRYKDNPDLLIKEHPELKCKKFEGWIFDFKGGVIEEDYFEWLFKLTFKGVME